MYISFEGMDGGGKSTIMERVAERLRNDEKLKELGYTKVVTSCEPKGIFRDMILDVDNKLGVTELARLFLFQSDRNIHTNEIIKPNINNNDTIVLVDRGPLSTLAYQSISTGMQFDRLADIINVANEGYWPDYYMFFDLDYETSVRREKGGDHFEQKGREFFDNVNDNYIRFLEHLCGSSIYGRLRARHTIVDATKSVDQVEEKVYNDLFRYIVAYDMLHRSFSEF